ncbi:MAG: hypothetical protein MJ097_00445 [Dorea sp.]|nr:hypothetical protein [Dorea sp.]
MSEYARIDKNAFDELQKEAGMILSTFDVTGKTPIADEDIIDTTTGGVKVDCKPSMIDLGSDIDNVPEGVLELQEVKRYDCAIGYTGLKFTDETLKRYAGKAGTSEVSETKAGTKVVKITPKMGMLTKEDAMDIWWVGPTSGGGWCACCLKNAVNTDGLSIQTQKDDKGNISVNLKGHYSIDNLDEVPMEFYYMKPVANAAE